MDTGNKKSIWLLVAAIAFIIAGSYRLYNHFFNDAVTYDTLRVVLGFAFLIYGSYRLFSYLKS